MISLYDRYLARCHQFMLPGKWTINFFLIAFSLHHILVVQYRNHIFFFPSMGKSNELCMYFTLGHLYSDALIYNFKCIRKFNSFGLKSKAYSRSQTHYIYWIWFLTGLLPEFQEKKVKHYFYVGEELKWDWNVWLKGYPRSCQAEKSWIWIKILP